MDETIKAPRRARLITAAIILLCVVIVLQLGILLQRQIMAGSPPATTAVQHPVKRTGLVDAIRARLSPKPAREVSPDTVWDPADQIAHMHEQINRMFEQTVRDSFTFPLAPAAASNATTSSGSAPFHDPFTHINRMRREINAMFAIAMKDFEGAHPRFDEGWANLDVTPGLSVRDTPSAYEITMILPGIDKSRLQLSMDGRILRIVVTTPEPPHDADHAGVAWSARHATRFERRLFLPAATSQCDTVKATCENGVLRVVVPKTSEAESATGQIKVI
jgi:HSP20 family protein